MCLNARLTSSKAVSLQGLQREVTELWLLKVDGRLPLPEEPRGVRANETAVYHRWGGHPHHVMYNKLVLFQDRKLLSKYFIKDNQHGLSNPLDVVYVYCS
jgi:hypothetical protein